MSCTCPDWYIKDCAADTEPFEHINGCALALSEPVFEHSCDCGALPDEHEFEAPGCEYFEHHCETCHARGACTLFSCVENHK